MHRLTIPLCVLLAGCAGEAASPTHVPRDTVVTPLRVQPWALPVTTGGAQPDLVAAPDGSLLLSWLENRAKGHALRMARFTTEWSPPMTIAHGNDWFANWADTPHVMATEDGTLWAHWLRKSAAAAYAYDVVLVRSTNGGARWSTPLRVNQDGTPTEHGFVSLWPEDASTLGIAWLDGRNTAGAGHDAHHGARGAMTLRSTTFDGLLARAGETELDAAVCDCCQTDAAMTTDGPVLVYRDRLPGEIRDISVARRVGDTWQTPTRVHADNWVMEACPVNGPAIDADGRRVLVAWYTAAGGVPRVRAAQSRDAGVHFDAPLDMDAGDPVHGRVDVALDASAGWVLWLREDQQGQHIRLAQLDPSLRRVLQTVDVATLQGRGRGTGFPQLMLWKGRPHVVWTDIVEGKPRLAGAVIDY